MAFSDNCRGSHCPGFIYVHLLFLLDLLPNKEAAFDKNENSRTMKGRKRDCYACKRTLFQPIGRLRIRERQGTGKKGVEPHGLRTGASAEAHAPHRYPADWAASALQQDQLPMRARRAALPALGGDTHI